MKARTIANNHTVKPIKIQASAAKLTKKLKPQRSIVKIVGANGQISLGKAYAGRSIEISNIDENTIVIKTGQFIPDNEKWLYEGDNMARLDKAIKSAEGRPRNYDNFEELMAKFETRIAKNE